MVVESTRPTVGHDARALAAQNGQGAEGEEQQSGDVPTVVEKDSNPEPTIDPEPTMAI